MKTIKGWIPTTFLALTLALSAVNAEAGILITGLKGGESQPCTEDTTKVNSGILITGFTGILITGFTGILITGAVDAPSQENCGILITG